MIFPNLLSYSKKARIVTVALLAAFFIVGGLSLYIVNKPNGSEHTKLPTVNKIVNGLMASETSPKSSVVSSIPSYANWQAFTGSKRYSLKYPNSWFDTRDDNTKQTSPNEMFISNENIKFPKMPSTSGILIHSSYISAADFPDIDKIAFTSPIGQFKIPGIYDPMIIFTKIANLKIGAYPAVEYSIDGSADNSNLNYTLQYDINQNGNLYYIAFMLNKSQVNKYSSQISQILNSLTIN